MYKTDVVAALEAVLAVTRRLAQSSGAERTQRTARFSEILATLGVPGIGFGLQWPQELDSWSGVFGFFLKLCVTENRAPAVMGAQVSCAGPSRHHSGTRRYTAAATKD